MVRKILLIVALLVMISCQPRIHEVKDTDEIMGTYVSVTIHDHDQAKARQAMDMAFAEMRRIENVLSIYDNSSEVFTLNEEKTVKPPSSELSDNLQKAIYYSNLSDGAFDITVQPILDLYRSSFRDSNRPPSPEEIDSALDQVDYRRIVLNDDAITIGKDQKITLGALAKGYAVDKAASILEQNGIRHALINAGGDMRALGNKYQNNAWRIALENPRDKGEYIAIFDISDKAIVTSGDYERYFDENMSFHHIIDPRTGYSARELISVTILADRAFDADAISTTVFVLGKEGMQLIESIDGVEGLIITNDKEILRSSGLDHLSIP